MTEDKSIANDPMRGLLDALMGGKPVNAPTENPSAGGAFSDLLGTMMGDTSPNANAPTSGASDDPLSSLLGGLLGGSLPQATAPTQDAAGGEPMNALLGGLLGGGIPGDANTNVLGNNSFLAPIIQTIVAKFGIPPQIAETIISFALTQLLSGQGGQLAQLLGAKGTVSQKYLRDSGLANQLAEQTGMDSKTAAKSLQQVLDAFGAQMNQGA